MTKHWKYTRSTGRAGRRTQDDKKFLVGHHLNVPAKAKASQAKHACKAMKQDLYKPGKELIFSNLGPGPYKWVKSRSWMRKDTTKPKQPCLTY